MTLDSIEHTHKTENSWCEVFLARLPGFGQLGLTNDSQIVHNGLNDDKIPENISYTIVKYGETFYSRNTEKSFHRSHFCAVFHMS